MQFEDDKRHAKPDQPYIHRLTHLGVAAQRLGKGLAFVDEVSRLLWNGIKGWDQGNHLAEATSRAGLDLAEMEDNVRADPDDREAEVQANQAALAEAGPWGVPNLVFEGEPFFGQDRIDQCVWRMKQKGLATHI